MAICKVNQSKKLDPFLAFSSTLPFLSSTSKFINWSLRSQPQKNQTTHFKHFFKVIVKKNWDPLGTTDEDSESKMTENGINWGNYSSKGWASSLIKISKISSCSWLLSASSSSVSLLFRRNILLGFCSKYCSNFLALYSFQSASNSCRFLIKPSWALVVLLLSFSSKAGL